MSDERKTCDLCGDEHGVPTGWASETNPGTGGGTGRDEQIAVECPNGCSDPTEPPLDARVRIMRLASLASGEPEIRVGEDGRVVGRWGAWIVETDDGRTGWAAEVRTLAANDEPSPTGATPTAAQGVDDEQGEDPRF